LQLRDEAKGELFGHQLLLFNPDKMSICARGV